MDTKLCGNCYNAIPLHEKSCPKCGYEQPPVEPGELFIRRKWAWGGALYRMSIWVDGIPYESLKNDESTSILLLPGVHRVKCQLFLSVKEFDVDIEGGCRTGVKVWFGVWGLEGEFINI